MIYPVLDRPTAPRQVRTFSARIRYSTFGIRPSAFITFLLATVVLLAAHPADQPWRTASPEQVGLDSEPLAQMFEFVREKQIPVHSVQIVRQGRLALDAYFYPYRRGLRHDAASVTKSI